MGDDAEISRLNNKLTTFYNETINTLKKYKGDDIDKDTAIVDIERQRDGFNGFMKEAKDNEDKLAVVRHFNNLNTSLFEKDYTGGRRNKPAYDTMTMKDIKELCKANQIKLSRVVNDKRVVYKKKELITKLKRKKVF
jgi:hypothetical protein